MGLMETNAPDVTDELRLRMYRLQVEIREAEQRAYDLFLQNLVRGTSHLSLGQEAVAAGCAAAMQPGDLTFCTYRGHAHTMARGAPVEAVLGELKPRDRVAREFSFDPSIPQEDIDGSIQQALMLMNNPAIQQRISKIAGDMAKTKSDDELIKDRKSTRLNSSHRL